MKKQNYKESKKILEEIKKAKNILLNCHKHPDYDSISSALSMYYVLKRMNKEVDVYSPSKLPGNIDFLPNSGVIKEVKPEELNLAGYDLIIILDTSSWDHATGLKVKPDDLNIVVIDHHKSNELFGNINLVRIEVQSNCEVLYFVFKDWDVKLDKVLGKCLLTGILSDTGVFKYPGVTSTTLEVAKNIIDAGVDMQEILFRLVYSIPVEHFKYMGEVFLRMNVDSVYNYVWAAVPYDIYNNYGGDDSLSASDEAAFFQSIQGSDFGILMTERKKNKLSINFRSRTGLDTSKIAVQLGGGGHIYASGASIEGLPFDEAVEKVLKVARKYAKKNRNAI